MSRSKLILLLCLAAAILAIIYWLPADVLTLENLKAQRANIESYRLSQPLLSIVLFCAVYIIATALSIPGAALLTIASGAIFGLILGTAIVSVSSTIGATLAFLLSRYFFKDAVKQKFGDRLISLSPNFCLTASLKK